MRRNILFASEMLGAVRGADPATGVEWDNTLVYVKAAGLSISDERSILHDNAVEVYPGLQERTDRKARGNRHPAKVRLIAKEKHVRELA
jgi:4-oxalmesaconate hydratase